MIEYTDIRVEYPDELEVEIKQWLEDNGIDHLMGTHMRNWVGRLTQFELNGGTDVEYSSGLFYVKFASFATDADAALFKLFWHDTIQNGDFEDWHLSDSNAKYYLNKGWRYEISAGVIPAGHPDHPSFGNNK